MSIPKLDSDSGPDSDTPWWWGSGEVFVDGVAGAGAGVGPEFSAGVDTGVDAGMDVVTDDGTQLAATGVDEFTGDGRTMIGAVVAEVGGDGAGTEIYPFANDGVAGVAEVTDAAVGHDNGCFDLHGLADVAMIADGGGTAQVAIRADFAVAANDDGAFDIDAGKDAGAFIDEQHAIDFGAGMHMAKKG